MLTSEPVANASGKTLSWGFSSLFVKKIKDTYFAYRRKQHL